MKKNYKLDLIGRGFILVSIILTMTFFQVLNDTLEEIPTTLLVMSITLVSVFILTTVVVSASIREATLIHNGGAIGADKLKKGAVYFLVKKVVFQRLHEGDIILHFVAEEISPNKIGPEDEPRMIDMRSRYWCLNESLYHRFDIHSNVDEIEDGDLICVRQSDHGNGWTLHQISKIRPRIRKLEPEFCAYEEVQ